MIFKKLAAQAYYLALALSLVSAVPSVASAAGISRYMSFRNNTGGTVRIEKLTWSGSYNPQFSTLTPAPGASVSGTLRTVFDYGQSYFSFEVVRTGSAPADRCSFYMSVSNSSGSISSAYGYIIGTNAGGSSCNASPSSSGVAFSMSSPPPPPPVDFYFDAGSLTPSITTTEGSVNISYSVTSPGTAPTLPSVGFFLADEAYQPLIYFGAIPVSSATGSDHAVQLSFAGLGLTPGNYNVILYADVNEEVTESNEDNNLGAFAIILTEEPAAGSEAEIVNQWLNQHAPQSSLIPAAAFIDQSQAELKSKAVETTGLLQVLDVK